MKTTKLVVVSFILTFGIMFHAQPQDLTAGLIAYYPFNGDATDQTGHGNNATPTGISLATDRFGIINACYDFNGNGQANITNTLLLNNSTAATITGWFLRRASITTGFVIGAGDLRAGFDPFSFVVTPSFQIQAQFTDTSLGPPNQGVGYGGGPGLVVQSNTWYQFAMVFDSGSSTSVFRLFLNGSLMVVSNYNHSQRIFYDQTMPVQVGALTSQTDSRFVGMIDDVRFYNRALSSSEVSALYTLGPGPYVSLIKAVKPALVSLFVGTNYQLQLSGDLLIWTNHGAPFTATNSIMVYPQYWDVDNWGKLFFRLQVAP